MNREDLVQVNGPAEAPPETKTILAADEDGTLHRVTYRVESIEPANPDR